MFRVSGIRSKLLKQGLYGDNYRAIKGDTRSLDYSSDEDGFLPGKRLQSFFLVAGFRFQRFIGWIFSYRKVFVRGKTAVPKRHFLDWFRICSTQTRMPQSGHPLGENSSVT